MGARLPIAIPSLFSTTDVITIWIGILGVLVGLATLVVTGSGLAIAILTIFGYQTFKDMIARAEITAVENAVEAASKKSDAVARESVDKYLKGGDFDAKIKEIGSQMNWHSGTVTGESVAPLNVETPKGFARKYPQTPKKL